MTSTGCTINGKISSSIFQINNKNIEIIKITNDGKIYINGKLTKNEKLITNTIVDIFNDNNRYKLKEEIRNNSKLYQEILLELRNEKIENVKQRINNQTQYCI